jgi:NitT/TauT family transport system substrate-binding protein
MSRSFLVLFFKKELLVLLGLVLLARPARAVETLTLDTIEDPIYEAAIWALETGKVVDPTVDIKVQLMPIPRNQAATMAQAFNITSTGVMSVPQLAEGGINAKIFATAYRYKPEGHAIDVWVMKSSPYQSVMDLKGKTVASQTLENQGTTSLRMIMAMKYGMNADTVGGDLRWVEMPSPQLEPALQSGKIDAAVIGTMQAFTAEKKGLYRSVLQGPKELEALYGGPMPTVVFIGFEPDMDKRPAAYMTAARLLRESSEYMVAHDGEVFAAVAPKYRMDPADLAGWFARYSSMPFSMTQTDEKIFLEVWQAGQKLGLIAHAPASADAFVWSKAVVEK